MIYTVTFNPALDYVVKINSLDLGSINRSESENIFCGGKGINVSLVLRELGIESVALGFVAGFTGKALEDRIFKKGIKTDFVHLKNGFSRINVKLKSDKETDINGQGPKIDNEAINELFSRLEKLKKGDILVLAGSIPNTLPQDIYEKIFVLLNSRDIKFVVDATGDLLVNVLKYKPFLIKPNNFELGEIFSIEIKTEEKVIKYARKMQEMGACNVLVSMAGDGAVLVDDKGFVHKIGVPDGKVVNSVGAGDSMVAGFIAGYIEKNDYDYALKLGTAAGSATAFSDGLADAEKIKKLLAGL